LCTCSAHAPRTLVYLYKVPKWFVEEALTKLDPRLDMGTLMKMQKKKQANKLIMHRILYFGLMVSPSDRIFAYDHKLFHKMAKTRHDELGKPLTRLTLPSETGEEIDWFEQGFFKLLPAREPGGENASKHRYLQVQDNFTKKVCDLPEHMVVTAAWTLENNFIYKDAVVVTPRHAKPQWKSRILDFFDSLVPEYSKKFAPEALAPQAAEPATAAQAADGDAVTPVGKGTKRHCLADAAEQLGVDGMPIRQALTPQEFSSKLARLHKAAKKGSIA
jgi:hypothetical protein